MISVNHERMVLAGMIAHENKRFGWVEQLSVEFFKEYMYKMIFEVIRDNLEKSQNELFMIISNEAQVKGFEVNSFIEFVDFDGYLIDSDYSFRELKKFKRYEDLKKVWNAINPNNPKEKQIDRLLECIESTRKIDLLKNNLSQGARMVATDMIMPDRKRELLTGFAPFDEHTNGLRNGVYLITGRPGMGKTTYSFQLGIEFSKQNPELEVLFFSLEMSLRDCNYKTTSYLTKTPMFLLERNKNEEDCLDSKQMYEIAKEMNNINTNMTIVDISGISCMQIDNIINNHEKETKRKVGAIFIDYVQIMTSNNPKITDETARVQAISHEVRELGKKLPVFALAQLNRNTTANERPKLGDLKGSGQLEQDATMVFTMYQEDDQVDIVKGGVIKNRYGKNGRFDDYFFNKPISAFKLYLEGQS